MVSICKSKGFLTYHFSSWSKHFILKELKQQEINFVNVFVNL